MLNLKKSKIALGRMQSWYYAVRYTQKPGRMEMEQELRNLYDLTCGKR